MSRFASIQFTRPTAVVSVALLAVGLAGFSSLVLQIITKGEFLASALTAADLTGLMTSSFVATASLIGALSLLALNPRPVRNNQQTGSLLSGLENDAFRSLIYEIDPSCMKILDGDGRIIAMNQAGLDIVDAQSCDLVIGELVFDLLLPEHHDPYMEMINRTLSGETTGIEFKIQTFAGTRKWLRQVAKTHYCPVSERNLVFCITRDITESKLNKDRLDLAIDVTNQGLWDEYLETDQLFYNTNWYTMLGYAPDELPMTSESWRKLVHPDDIENANADFLRHVDQELDTYSSEYRMRAKDGSWKWIKDIGRIVERKDGSTPVRAIGLHVDIDAKKRHELTLRSVVSLDATTLGTPTLTNLCRSLAEAFDLECVGITKLVENDHGTVIAGWHDGEPTEPMTYNLAGTPCSVAIKFDYYHCETDVCNRFSEDTILKEMNADGYAGLALCGNDGTRIGLIYIVTKKPLPSSKELESSIRLVGARVAGEFERQRIEKNLHTSQGRLKLAMDAAKFGHWDWNPESGEAVFSDEIYSMLGYDPRAHQDAMAWWNLICQPDDANTISSLINKCIIDEAPWDAEVLLRKACGGNIWVRAVGVFERHDDDNHRVFGTFQDITDSKNTQFSLERAKDAAESACRAKGDFLANMSHEIRTPMTAIMGNADLLADNSVFMNESELFQSSVGAIGRNAEHLMTIINDILDTSKIDAGMLNIESVEIEPYVLIAEAAEMLSSRAPNKEIELAVNFLCELPRRIESDPTRIRQIIINLIGNALKFTEKGTVRVDVGYNPLPNRSGLLTISVVDTGIGISETDLDSLQKFEPFSQADGSTTRKYGGTGLGLRITNELTKMLAGTLTLTSELGKGTTATATLQVKPVLDHGMWHPPTKKIPEHPGKIEGLSTDQVVATLDGTTILLVEDGEDNQILLNHMLRTAGVSVVNAINGADAIRIFKERNTDHEHPTFDLVLMDMQMPEIDGYNATSILRKLGYHGPVVALTAHAMAGDREKCLAAGCQDYLTKPVRSATLLQTCAKQIGFRNNSSKAA